MSATTNIIGTSAEARQLAASRYADLGWAVFPVNSVVDGRCSCGNARCTRAGKHPASRLVPHGLKDATKGHELIGRWFAGDYNIAVATGKASGVVVLDMDGADGLHTLSLLPPLPTTVTAITGRDDEGRHLYFKHPGGRVPNFEGGPKGVDLPGLDFRGDGGYVILPPSQHRSGRLYQWEIEPSEHVLAEMPEWLAGLCNKDAASLWLAKYLLQAEAGNRNRTGFDLACQLRDSNVPRDRAEAVMRLYQQTVQRRGEHSYDWDEAATTLQGVFETPPRQSANSQQSVVRWNRTDAGNAELFAELNKDKLRHNHQRGEWLVRQEHWWEVDKDGEVTRLALHAARHRYRSAADIEDLGTKRDEANWAIASENQNRLNAAVSIARSIRPLADNGEGWNADPMLLGVANGVVDLRTGELHEGNPEQKITLHSDVAYDPAATCERWLRFLSEIFAGDLDVIDYMARYAGYSLTGNIEDQSLVVCYGIGANGKSTLINTLRKALGQYGHHTEVSTLLHVARHGGGPSTELATLRSKRMVSAIEMNEGVRLNEGLIKGLTGGDPITARHLHQELQTFEPQAKFWLGVNHKPVVRDDSHGFWRRVRFVPFTQTFERGEDLDATFAREMPGILAWAVRGCLEYQRLGLEAPESVKAATEEYRVESDPLVDFISERCVVEPTATVSAAELYYAYADWAESRGLKGADLLSAAMFGRRAGRRFDKNKSTGRVRYYGVGLKPQALMDDLALSADGKLRL